MRTSAFVPGHITGFFKPMLNDDPLKSGSTGCGLVISKGVFTNVVAREASEDSINIFLDGEEGKYPVSLYAAKEVLKKADGNYKVDVYHESEIPISQGFGASGAGALGTSIALSDALKLPFTLNECGAIAHKAEVVNGTGLGDVLAQSSGGMVLRLSPGAPGIGIIDKIPCDLNIVAWTVGPPFETKNVLKDEGKRKKLASLSEKSMKLLLKHPDPENFLHASRRFALDSGLMSDAVRTAVKILEEENIPASMAMLGNTIFTLTRDPKSLENILEQSMMVAEIDTLGGRQI